MVFMFCIGNVLPTGKKDLAFKPEPSALNIDSATADTQARNGKHVSTTVPTCHSVTLGDSDISKGVTTQTRRKKTQFLTGQK